VIIKLLHGAEYFLTTY